MKSTTATIDTSVLCSLQSAQLLGAISVLFDRVLVPQRVRKELSARAESNRAALSAIQEFAFFEHCDEFDASLVRWLLDTRQNLKQGRDEGEAEAVIQAAERSTVVLVDDPLGRKWAKSHAVECHGTIWLCRELRFRGYLRELRLYFLRMVSHGRRLPLEDMNRYLTEFDEALITQQEYESALTPKPDSDSVY
ncbi:MAG TPA: hypothetical protein VG206_02705 [Terriglobia bacterium]|nr:hypothetical protein [Terriglobia bacterium]